MSPGESSGSFFKGFPSIFSNTYVPPNSGLCCARYHKLVASLQRRRPESLPPFFHQASVMLSGADDRSCAGKLLCWFSNWWLCPPLGFASCTLVSYWRQGPPQISEFIEPPSFTAN